MSSGVRKEETVCCRIHGSITSHIAQRCCQSTRVIPKGVHPFTTSRCVAVDIVAIPLAVESARIAVVARHVGIGQPVPGAHVSTRTAVLHGRGIDALATAALLVGSAGVVTRAAVVVVHINRRAGRAIAAAFARRASVTTAGAVAILTGFVGAAALSTGAAVGIVRLGVGADVIAAGLTTTAGCARAAPGWQEARAVNTRSA